MSYAALEQKLRKLPEDCIHDLAEHIDFRLSRQRKGTRRETGKDLSGYFGAVKTLGDGLTAQRRMRDESGPERVPVPGEIERGIIRRHKE